jgi:hypothetical protein
MGLRLTTGLRCRSTIAPSGITLVCKHFLSSRRPADLAVDAGILHGVVPVGEADGRWQGFGCRGVLLAGSGRRLLWLGRGGYQRLGGEEEG